MISLNLEDDGGSLPTGGNLETTLQFFLLDFAMGYRLGKWPLGAAARPTLALEMLAGGRYVYLENGIEITGGPLGVNIDVDEDVDWIEPFIGALIKLALSKKLTMAVRGDVGGFGIGSDLTWNLVANFRYYLSHRVSLVGGYRVLDIDYGQGSDANRFEYDVQSRGPQLGLILHF